MRGFRPFLSQACVCKSSHSITSVEQLVYVSNLAMTLSGAGVPRAYEKFVCLSVHYTSACWCFDSNASNNFSLAFSFWNDDLIRNILNTPVNRDWLRMESKVLSFNQIHWLEQAQLFDLEKLNELKNKMLTYVIKRIKCLTLYSLYSVCIGVLSSRPTFLEKKSFTCLNMLEHRATIISYTSIPFQNIY